MTLRPLVSFVVAAVVVVTASSCRAAPAPREPVAGPSSSPSVSPTREAPGNPYRERCTGPVRSEALIDVRRGADPGVVEVVRSAVRQARRYFRIRTPDCDPFGVSVEVTNDATGPWAATVYGGNVYVLGGDEFWTQSPRGERYVVVFHEWYHLVQDELARYRRTAVPDWLAEGMAEWVAIKAGVHFGHLPSFEGVRAILRSRAATLDTPLRRLSRRVPPGEGYALAFMAIDELEVPERTLLRFWKILGEGEGWARAFEGVFGISPKRFYRRFERARAAGFP